MEGCAFGRGLNVAQQIATKASIRKLQMNENFGSVQVWGQILGQENDYIIVQAVNYGATIEKNYYFSIDQGQSFSKLPPVDGFIHRESHKVRGLFTGNPSRRCYSAEALAAAVPQAKSKDPRELKEKALDADDLMSTPPLATKGDERVLLELERLAHAVNDIENDTCLTPTGYYYFSAQSVIQQNNNFAGIPVNANLTMANFQLFREPRVPKTLASRRSNANTNTFAFLDPVDQPDTWRLSSQDGGLSVRARSLLWPGLEVNITKGADCRYSRLYFGYGEKNSDLAFML